jgi:mono/diheme cytochrome c family protein
VKAKSGLMAIGILVGAVAASVGPAAVAGTPVYEQQKPVVGEHQNFRNLYRLRCGTCHGAEGEGTATDYPRLAPALRGNPFVQHAPAAAVIQVIRHGRSGQERLYPESVPNMPAFGAEAVFDVDGLVNFLKTDLQR